MKKDMPPMTDTGETASESPASPESQDSENTDDALESLEVALGRRFTRRQLLLDALTHRSYVYENAAPDVVSNERLEFLGDAALSIVASELLYRRFPKANEGELTDLRASLVRASTLATFARELPLGPYLRLGRGEEVTGGRDRELLIARAMEALIGAIYLDGGLRATRAFLEPRLVAELARIKTKRQLKDDKSLLQEVAQAQLNITPTYRLVSQEGPSHSRVFTVEVLLGERVAGRGEGTNKRQAEQAAAHMALADEGWQIEE
jgi:ribonuclease-3